MPTDSTLTAHSGLSASVPDERTALRELIAACDKAQWPWLDYQRIALYAAKRALSKAEHKDYHMHALRVHRQDRPIE